MDWNKSNFDWNKAKSFLALVEKGSFVEASKLLKINQTTLSRQVSSLEDELGVALVQKIGKGIEITPIGLDLSEHIKIMGDAATSFALEASGKNSLLEGNVAISATEPTAIYILPTIVKEIQKLQPKIKIEIISTDSSSDLRKREADIAIRNFQPKHPDLICKKLRNSFAYFYASKDFIEANGPFEVVKDLENVSIIGFPDQEAFLKGMNSLGLSVKHENFNFLSKSLVVNWGLVKAGAGFCVMTEFVGDKEKDVEKLFPDKLNFLVETWVVSHRDLKNSRKIRFVYDYIADYFNTLE